MNISIRINDLILALNAIKHTVPTRDVRHYLNGVRVEVHDIHATFIGTDGHRLATCRVYLEFDGPAVPITDKVAFTINADHIAQIVSWAKQYSYKGGKSTVQLEYKRCEGEPDNRGVPFALPGELWLRAFNDKAFYATRPHDETFPDWGRVMITDAAAAQSLHSRQCFNGDYLADVAKVAKLFNAKYGGIRVHLLEGMALLTCRNDNGVEFRETLMGMRD